MYTTESREIALCRKNYLFSDDRSKYRFGQAHVDLKDVQAAAEIAKPTSSSPSFQQGYHPWVGERGW
jgi:hypothetical protein